MTLQEILLKLTLIECELDDATNSLPDWNGNSDSRGNIDGAKDELYNLKDEIERAILDEKKVLSGKELEEVMNTSPTLAKLL